MPYIPRAVSYHPCAHCGQTFESRNLRRKYCSNSCNVLASYERTGRREERGGSHLTKADLENVVKAVIELVNTTSTISAPSKPGLAKAKAQFQELATAQAKTERLAEAKANLQKAAQEHAKRERLEEAKIKLREAIHELDKATRLKEAKAKAQEAAALKKAAREREEVESAKKPAKRSQKR